MYRTLRHAILITLFIHASIHSMQQNNSQHIEHCQSSEKERYIVYPINEDCETIVYPNRKIPTPKRNNNGRYKCHFCEREYDKYDTVKSHMRQHVNRTIHQCKKCSYYSTNKNCIYDHITTHHNYQEYCDVCDMYLRHLKDHKKGYAHQQNYKKSIKDPNEEEEEEKEEEHYDVLSNIGDSL